MNGPFRVFFSRSANIMLIWHILDPTILILIHTFCEIGKNDPYILKNVKFLLSRMLTENIWIILAYFAKCSD
jgi:hypothetical protein